MPTPIPFSQAWTLNHTRRLVDADHGQAPAGVDQAKWRFNEAQPIWEGMKPLLVDHLRFLQKQGRLSDFPEGCRPQTSLARHWGNLLSGNLDEYGEKYLGDLLVSALRLYQVLHGDHLQARHAILVSTLEKGDFEWIDLRQEECRLTGKPVCYEMKGWGIAAGNEEGGKFAPAKPGDFDLAPLQAIEIPVPSGKLLASDWFHIPGFREIMEEVETKDQFGSVEISSTFGCQIRTQDYARVGVAHVFAGSGGSNIVVDQGQLRMGQVEDGHPLENKSVGSISHELWWGTLVDRQILVGLLARKHADPEKVLEEYLKTTNDQITQIDIEPGTWHLYGHGSTGEFAKQCEFAIDREGFSDLVCVLSKDPLSRLDQKPAAKRGPR